MIEIQSKDLLVVRLSFPDSLPVATDQVMAFFKNYNNKGGSSKRRIITEIEIKDDLAFKNNLCRSLNGCSYMHSQRDMKISSLFLIGKNTNLCGIL